MTKKICFVTTNKTKFQTAKEKAKPYNVELVQRKLETPEIQSYSAKDVAEYSAKFAAEKIEQPCIATDAAFEIPALNGFPGPFIKYVNGWFTAEDFLRLMKGVKDRRLELVEFVAYCEPGKKPKSYKATSQATIARKASTKKGTPIQRLFIPEGKKRVAAELSDQEMQEFWRQNLVCWDKLFNFLHRTKRINKK